VARLRREGRLAAPRRAGCAVPDGAMVGVGFATREGRIGLGKIRAARSEVTAVIWANDVLAVGAMLQARDLGLDIPADLSITGFDGMDVAREFSPPITTIDVSADVMGHRTSKYLLARLKDEDTAHHIEIPIEMAVGGSTARPRP